VAQKALVGNIGTNETGVMWYYDDEEDVVVHRVRFQIRSGELNERNTVRPIRSLTEAEIRSFGVAQFEIYCAEKGHLSEMPSIERQAALYAAEAEYRIKKWGDSLAAAVTTALSPEMRELIFNTFHQSLRSRGLELVYRDKPGYYSRWEIRLIGYEEPKSDMILVKGNWQFPSNFKR